MVAPSRALRQSLCRFVVSRQSVGERTPDEVRTDEAWIKNDQLSHSEGECIHVCVCVLCMYVM